ncbi:MAG: nicotinate-nucleotide adenylyltransferase [Candidatus Hydrogenedentes bacterium]|nr:nicotinate-nucleotide adenylyltransferase [Candidatus Hydrogenedentota bacterium]
MTTPKRIGVYGGTFDPIHNVHLEIARAARGCAALDVVLFVIAARPPHKANATFASPENRIAMVQAAVCGEAGMDYSCLEFNREGPSYTGQTLVELHGQFPGSELFLIIGMDSLVDLPKWRDPEIILEHAELLVLPRPGSGTAQSDMATAKFRMIPFQETDLSSTEVRERIARGERIDDLVPGAVERLIHDRGIYE